MSKISRRSFIKGAGAMGVTSFLNTEPRHMAPQDPPMPTYLPHIQKGAQAEGLNIITIVADSLRYDHISFLGNPWIHTPNLNMFASQSQVFDKAYAGGFPTVVNRSEIFTGRCMFHRMGWGDLPDQETTLAATLARSGYITGLIFDTWHIKDHGFSFDRDFQSWEWVRGQEGDRYRALPFDPVLPCSPSKLRDVEQVKQHLRNRAEVTSEEELSTPKTIRSAVSWLERYAPHGNFYLHIDCFDPHEPWDPPAHYIGMYHAAYTGEKVISPAYAPSTFLTEAELHYAQSLYAAEVSMVDHWLGVFFDALDTMKLSDNTLVIFCSDHGYLLGEHEKMGKSWDHEGHYESYPLYQELVHIPLMIRAPGVPGKRIAQLAQPIDIMPTIIDYIGIPHSAPLNGLSLRPTISNPAAHTRQVAVSSPSLRLSPAVKPMMTVTDGRWVLIYGALHAPSHLYDLESDPSQQNNLIGAECQIARNLHIQLLAYLQSIPLSEDQIAAWSASPCE